MEYNIDDKNKKMPFDVPEGYFEGFEDKMMAKLKALEAEEAECNVTGFEKVRDLNAAGSRNLTWRKWTSGIAAAAVLLAGIYAVMHLQNDVAQTGEEIVTAAMNGNDAYYDEINNELNSDEIEEALAQIAFEDEGLVTAD